MVVSGSGVKINKYSAFLHTANKFLKREARKNIEILIKEALLFVVNFTICNNVKAVFNFGPDLIPQIFKPPIWFWI